MKSWKKLSEKVILEHPRIIAYEDEVQLPSGHKTTYLRFSGRPDAACVIAQNEKGEILLSKEYSYPPNTWLYQPPGGALEAGEDPKTGASRELGEEAGYKGDLTELGWYYVDNRRSDAKFYVFLATNLKECPRNLDIEEEIENYWFTPKTVEQMIKEGKIPNVSFLAAWSLYKAHLSA